MMEAEAEEDVCRYLASVADSVQTDVCRPVVGKSFLDLHPVGLLWPPNSPVFSPGVCRTIRRLLYSDV